MNKLLLSIPRSLWRSLRFFLVALLGQLNWQPPAWLRGAGGLWKKLLAPLGRHPLATTISLLVLLTAGIGGWQGWEYYKNLPQPHTVDYRIDAPTVTSYDQEEKLVSPLQIHFNESAAPLALVDKPVQSGIIMNPKLEGSWRWVGDRTLSFMPREDWPVGETIRLDFSKEDLLDKGVLLANYQATFQTAPFTMLLTKKELYQDPEQPDIKKMVTNLRFSHPVDEGSLRRAIHVELGQGLAFRDKKEQQWSLSLNEKHLEAYIHSASLDIPLETAAVALTVDKDAVKAERGGPPATEPVAVTVQVPGRYRLAFTEPVIQYINSKEGVPQQVLMFESSFPVDDAVIQKHVHAWLLPQSAGTPFIPKDMDTLEPVTLEQIPSAEPLNTVHSFVLKVPTERYLALRIDAEVEAIGGYLSKKQQVSRIFSGVYPQILRLMGDGALLSLSGEKRVGFMAQGVSAIRVEVARILPGQLHHVLAQNYRGFAHPSVYSSEFDRLVERMTFTREYGAVDPSQPIYDSINLSDYLNEQGGRRGIFVLRLTPYDPKEPDNVPSDYQNEHEIGDRRLLLVSDLGLIAKRSLDGSREVFVQSLADGKPKAGVLVAIGGRNGLPVSEGLTDAQGRVHFPQVDELRREKTPIVVTASLNGDFSYLPLGESEHRVDLSRFDIGGEANQRSPDAINAFVFTERSLYRPGETAHIAYILRTADWANKIAGIPLRLQVYDARGAKIWEDNRPLALSGFDSFDFSTSAAAVTGEYSVSIYLVKKDSKAREQLQYLGGSNFMVQEFEPDRIKVQLQLSAKPIKGWLRPEDVQALVKARHLFGADASDRRVASWMELSPAFPAFKEYSDYRFHVDTMLEYTSSEELADTTTDEKGEAELAPDLSRFQAESYRLSLRAQVFEAQGGRNVAAEQKALISKADWLIGVKSPDSLEYVSKDAVRSSHWLAVNPDLQPVEARDLQLLLVEYRYVSILVKQDDGTYKYTSRRKEQVRENSLVTIPAKGLDLTLPTKEPGDFAYELRNSKGKLLNRLTWTVAGEGNLSRSLERNAELQIRLDKKSYEPGEAIQISLRAPYTGSGLITIERDKVYAWAWFKTDTTSSVQQIVVPEGLEGNAYVNVQFVRDPGSPEIFMSPLSSGVAPFNLSLKRRTLPLQLDAPSLIKPGGQMRVHLSAGTQARALVFAVDEGILQVVRYQTPTPLPHFFPKRSLDVDTEQILSLILPEFSLLYRAAAPGGGGEDDLLDAHLNPFKRKNKPPVVYWSGLVDLPPEGRDFSYTVPDSFNGRLRIIAVALTPDRIGVQEAALEVRGPWIITPNVPAFVAPGDECVISAGVFNNLATEQKLQFSLKPDTGFNLLDGASRELTLAPQREGTVEFRLKAEEHLGSVGLDFIATNSTENTSVHEEVSIRPATPYRVALQAGLFKEKSLSIPLQRDLYDAYRRVTLGLGRSPLTWSTGLRVYLEEYPHACTEQLLSRVMPILILAETDPFQDTSGFEAINRAFNMLRQRLNSSGGFNTWENSSEVSPEVSVYVADFLLEARERGYSVPSDLERYSRNYLEQLSRAGAEGLPELQNKARAIYLLTRQGLIMTSAMSSLVEQLERHHPKVWKADLTAAYLAATYALLKQEREAEMLIAGVSWSSVNEPQDAMQYGLYGDQLVHDAELMTLTARHFPKRLVKIPDSLLDNLGRQLSANQYHSLSAALLIRSFSLYGKVVNAEGNATSAEVVMADKTTVPLKLQGNPAIAPVPKAWERLILRKDETTYPGFYLLTEAGFDRQPPTETLRDGIEIRREYVDDSGKPVTQVKVGEEFTVRLLLRATAAKNIDQVAIVDLLPGGVEPIIARPDDGANGEGDGTGSETNATSGPANLHADFVNMRDDRVLLYATVWRDLSVFTYRVRAINAGTFQVPPPYAEGMYNRRMQGRGEAHRLDIVKP